MNREQIIEMFDKTIRNLQSKHDAFLGIKGEESRRSFKTGLSWAIDSIEILKDDIDRLEQQPEVSDSFEQCLREEFLINTQNYPKEYHKLFWDKFKRAETRFMEQSHHPQPISEGKYDKWEEIAKDEFKVYELDFNLNDEDAEDVFITGYKKGRADQYNLLYS